MDTSRPEVQYKHLPKTITSVSSAKMSNGEILVLLSNDDGNFVLNSLTKNYDLEPIIMATFKLPGLNGISKSAVTMVIVSDKIYAVQSVQCKEGKKFLRIFLKFSNFLFNFNLLFIFVYFFKITLIYYLFF